MKEQVSRCLLISGKNTPLQEIDILLNQKRWEITHFILSDEDAMDSYISQVEPDLLFLTEDILSKKTIEAVFPKYQSSQPTYIFTFSSDPEMISHWFKVGASDCFILPGKKSTFAKRVAEARQIWEDKQLWKADSELLQQDIQLIWNTIPVLISYITREHTFAKVNRKFLEVTGKEEKNVIGKSCFEVFPTQAAGYLKDDIEVMMTGQQKHNIIETINTSKGIQWIKTDKIPWRDKNGCIVGVIAYSFDITDVKSAEEAFKKSDSMLRQVLNTTPNPIFVKDKLGKYVLVNQAMANLYGLTTEQMVGETEESLANSLPGLDQETLLKRAFDDGQTIQSKRMNHDREELFKKADGNIKWLKTTTVPLPMGYGQLCLLGVSVDLTERKNSEILMEKQAKALHLTNAELKQFAYVAAHDLQEPLRMVASYVQLLAKRYRNQLDAEANEYINYAVEGAIRIHNLINDLLEYSQLNSHQNSFAATDCNQIVQKVVHKKSNLIEQTQAQVICNELPTIHADSRQMERLFDSLLDNSLKFSNGRPPEIKISSHSNETAWIFSVKDNGIGFDMQFVDKIFSIFQKLKPKAVSPGTGIGLSISKKIVESHGGEIWAESSPGNGATFYFSIPYPQENILETQAVND